MSVEPAGLLLTAALAIVMYLEQGWSYRRRVAKRLADLSA